MERSELAAWLQLLETPGLGLAGARRLLAGLGSPQNVIGAAVLTRQQWVAAGPAQALGKPSDELLSLIDRTWAWLQGDRRRDVLVLGDADYPAALLQTADPPLLLYLIGRRELLAAESLAIIGSRRPTPRGRDKAHELAHSLGQAGLTVVSGLALGIEAAAHAGALKGACGTIAVLGSGLDQIYPSSPQRLADEIAERGLLLSEYSLGSPPTQANFLRRNRIIAGLARGCLVVEAAPRSGSMITARLAAEAGRPVFTVPGSSHAPCSKGCQELLRQGAKLVARAEDMLEELRPSPTKASLGESLRDEQPADPPEPDGETGLVLAAMGYEPVSLDALQARGGWSTAQLNALLLDLELSGAVTRLPGQLFQRQGQA